MKKVSLFLSLAATLLTGISFAQQHCYTDEMHKKQVAAHPEITASQAAFNKQIAEKLSKMDLSRFAKRTTADTAMPPDSFWYDIPVVVHVIHDYGVEYMTDNTIYEAVKVWNITYAKLNPDTATVIAPFKKYIGNAHIRLHLAGRDPQGNPTKGITRHRTYLANNGEDQAKFDDWAPSSYMNLWFVNKIAGTHLNAAAYAYQPPTAEVIPHYDGVISLYDYIVRDNTINHEIGHEMNLDHTWGSNNNAAAGTCADGGTDEVDDTPPTIGHNVTGCTAAALYDTVCATNYYKIYPEQIYIRAVAPPHAIIDSVIVDSIANYPDTVNAENIMDYTYCSKMFTIGQVNRMHAALNSYLGGRKHLWSDSNLAATWAMMPRQDLKPIPEYSATYGANRVQYFTCPGTSLKFTNKTWNDTVTQLVWNFSNGATSPTTTIANPSFSSYISNSFTDAGWVKITMTATGNNSGDTTLVDSTSVFVADPIAKAGSDIVEEFNPDEDLAKWPTFNYYKNEFKWQHSYAGFYDSHSMMYNGFDSRLNTTLGIFPYTGQPRGDYDDFFSIPVDLSGFSATGACNMDFFTSAASRSSNSLDINDTMIISYSTDRGKNWVTMSTLAKSDLINKGAIYTPYMPTSPTDWVARTINIPALARQAYVVFRFRYLPNTDHNGYEVSTGNNFYMDRLSFSTFPAGVEDVKMGNLDAVVVPNPTNGNAFVVVKDASNTLAHIIVSDITGKTVYTANEQIVGNEARIEIPQSAIQAKGIYMVQTITGNLAKTQKLVVY